jgi:hypothetical protein
MAFAWPGKKNDKETPAATEEANLAAEDNVNAVSSEDTIILSYEAAASAQAAATTTPTPAPVMVAQAAPPKAASTPTSVSKKSSANSKTATRKKATTKRVAAKPQQANATGKPAVSQKPTPAELQARAQAKKSVPTVSMSETKAYKLFNDGNYDVAAPYFARMADEKRFVFTSDMSYERLDNIVKKYVDAQMANFLIKGEFEKTAAYVVRINEKNRNKKIQVFADAIFNDLKGREKKMVSIRDFRLSRYYADDESFLLSSPVGDYVLDVAMAGARSFKSNFYKLQLKDLDFSADTSGILVLSRFTIINPENNKQYIFNSGMSTQYDIAELKDFYTERLGSGTPKATQAVSDTIKGAFRSITPPQTPTTTATDSSANAAKTPAAAAVQNPFGSAEAAPTQKQEAAAQPAPPAEEAKVKISGDEMTLEN